MKSGGNNFFKYIFILVVIALICGAIYILYSNNDKNNEEDDTNNSTAEQNKDMSIVENLKMGITNFDTMNPILTKNREIVNIDNLIFDPLFMITSDYKLENCLANSITKKSDTSYEVKIDTNIKWQDGSSLISKDVEYTIEQIKNTGSIYTANVQHISNIEIIDSETFIINLDTPVPYFEYNLTFPIVSSRYYLNEDFVNSNKIPIGTGMYKIASINDNNILLVKNDRWRKFKTNPQKTQSITLQKYSAIGEIFNTFKLGNVDIVNTYMTNYTDYVGTMGYNKREYSGREYDFLSINCNDNILSDVAVRKAINYAINKETIANTILGGSKVISNSPLDYGSYLYNSEGVIEFNQDQAKQTLENAGWTYANSRWQKNINGYVRKINLSLVVSKSSEERVRVANSIKEQLASIGIIVNVVQVDDNKYQEYLNNKNYQLILTGVVSSVTPDLSYFYGQGNISNYYNEEVFEKIKAVDVNSFKEAQKIANEEVPHIGLYRNKGTIILNLNVGGEFSPNSNFLYYNFDKWYRQQ